MERFLKPERFSIDPNSLNASKQWSHWFRTFNNFVSSLQQHQTPDAVDKLNLLINYVDPSVYEYIAECTTYEAAVDLLKNAYIKPKNEIFARHVLATTKQEPGQNLDEFLQKLRALAKDCDFKQVTAEQNKNDFIRDAFICGLSSNHIRQRLLENNTLDLITAFEKARSLEMAEKQSQTYHLPPTSIPCGGATSCPQTDSMEHSGESNIPVTAANQREHDHNFAVFLKSAKDYNITFNESKSIISAKEIKLLGYLVSKGHIQPDPDRLKPLRDLNEPHNAKSQQCVIGMFAYYSSWIPKFSDKVHPLVKNNIFPLPQEVKESFELLKKEIEMAAVTTIDHESPLVVETDASDIAIAATLNQNGRPVAFFSRTLNQSERKHSSVEKEAYAIVESLRKWRHYLIGRHFQLVTDQKSVAFMYGNSPKGKIKNDKIQLWRIEMSCYNYDVVYRPGKENDAADAFSRSYCSSLGINTESLRELHYTLSHPGITRMAHFVKSKNLPYSLEEADDAIVPSKPSV
ncbi:retrovirus-related pol polyprotein from transposon 17.6 [Plakobranchus ocellatus]|uniref:Retrovirus-related pol polyprotein from transposon 17.6 n=1 Tax=Plakobranchus ocellatus TaxID=259542 RepID=A0AAV4BXM6_9GAST|nr:retrovirus-related pol polyprotein from transposon 17.6 [Plakobranchus ocellatus]